MSSQNPDPKPTEERLPQTAVDAAPATVDAAPAEDGKRAAARRRFLRMGAGGSAALVTIVHKRAFAQAVKIKKGTVASACVSLQGVPDMKGGFTSKKALQLSPMGTPKNLVCNPPPSTNTCLVPEGDKAKYYTSSGIQPPYFTKGQLKDGCGNLHATVEASYNYRLYEKGWCPVVFDADGGLTYDLNAKYWDYEKVKDVKDPVFVQKDCERP